MRLRSETCAALAVTTCVGLAVWGYMVRSDEVALWLFVALFLPALWGFVELAQSGDLRRETAAIMRGHRWMIAVVGLIVTLSIVPQLAIATGLISAEWGPTAWRFKSAVAGVALAAWGNYLPKQMSPWRHADEPFDWQGVHRFAARIAVLSGLTLVAVSIVLPLESAKSAAGVLIATFAIVVVGRKLISWVTHPQKGAAA